MVFWVLAGRRVAEGWMGGMVVGLKSRQELGALDGTLDEGDDG